MIIIEWDAVVIENALTDDAEEYWVSAGAEYNSESEIWVGQTSFTLNTTLPVSARSCMIQRDMRNFRVI